MKEFGKLTIKKGTVLLLDDKKNIKGGVATIDIKSKTMCTGPDISDAQVCGSIGIDICG